MIISGIILHYIAHQYNVVFIILRDTESNIVVVHVSLLL